MERIDGMDTTKAAACRIPAACADAPCLGMAALDWEPDSELIAAASAACGIAADDPVWARPLLAEILTCVSDAEGDLEAAADDACGHLVLGVPAALEAELMRKAVLALSSWPALTAWAVASRGVIPAYGETLAEVRVRAAGQHGHAD